jgi:pimeloyl-ACP methyl ester carboxylesterase
MRVLYLHGFASGPASRKATFFRQHLEAIGVRIDVPALDEGNFQSLTVSGQLRLCDRILNNEPAVLIGSSLGGYLAALYAARHTEVRGLVLLAPAFSFADYWEREMNAEQLAEWKQKGSISVFHYASGCEVPIGYQLLEDARNFEPYPDVRQPVLIIHGNHDLSVPVQESVRFADSHPNVELVRVESGHELTDVLDVVWQHSKRFLQDLNVVKNEC